MTVWYSPKARYPECEVNWALGSITMHKASRCNQISVELIQTLKDDPVKVLHSMWQKIWKTQQWPQDWKRSIFISIPKKGIARECSNSHTIALVPHTSKVTLKIFKPGFNSMWTMNFQKFKLDLKRQRNQRSSCQHLSKKHLFLLYWLQIMNTLKNSPRDGNTRPPDLPPEKSVCRSRSNS